MTLLSLRKSDIAQSTKTPVYQQSNPKTPYIIVPGEDQGMPCGQTLND